MLHFLHEAGLIVGALALAITACALLLAKPRKKVPHMNRGSRR